MPLPAKPRKKNFLILYCYSDFLHQSFKDIKAISLAIKALKKCPDIQDKSFNCRMCGKELKTWKSIQKGFGPICEKRYLNDVYKNQQMTVDTILKERRGNDGK